MLFSDVSDLKLWFATLLHDKEVAVLGLDAVGVFVPRVGFGFFAVVEDFGLPTVFFPGVKYNDEVDGFKLVGATFLRTLGLFGIFSISIVNSQ